MTVNTPLNGRVPDSMQTRTLTVSHAGNHDHWLAETAKAALIGEYTMSGGVVEIWKPADERRQGLARWRGPHQEITIFLPFRWWENHEFSIAYFEDLTFHDSAVGVTAEPTNESVTIGVTEVSVLAASVGLIEIRTAAAGLRSLPPWAGLNVPAGEVWKVETEDDPDRIDHLVLASPTAVSTLSPASGATLDEGLDFLTKITNLDYRKRVA